MQFKKDSLALGIVLGIIGPWVGMFIYYMAQFNYMTLSGYASFLMTHRGVQSPILSLSLIINMVVYYLFYHYHLDKTTKGILLATFLYAPLVVYLKIR